MKAANIVKQYNTFESCWQQRDGREQIHIYLKERFNEELLLCLEMTERNMTTLTVFDKNNNELVIIQFKELYNQFVSNSAQQCVNICGRLRDKFTKEFIAIIDTTNNYEIKTEKLNKLYSSLKKELIIQFKTEIFPSLKKLETFQIFLLSKIIEATTEPEIEIETVLKTNEMEEYCKLFSKKKLMYLSQLKEYTSDDYRKLGIKKLGHIKRLLRIVKQQPLTTAN
ncbi:hypothetical protein ABK040_000121 [Willaertia magna]